MNSMSHDVEKIITQVRTRGDKALLEFTRRFDRVILKNGIRVPLSKARLAFRKLDSNLRQTLETCAERIRRFHEEEKRRILRSWTSVEGEILLGQRVTPVDSVGIYIPGGRFSYPSTVLMTAIPARVAGVKRLVMATPPKRLDEVVLAAAFLAGVDEIDQVGGPAAIAAFAYGTRSIPPVDMIVGPGNALVTEAKRQVFGTVGIDSLAGPSELVIIADSSANAAALALDLEAQAEHDPASTGLLISLDAPLLKRVKRDVTSSLLPRCRFVRARSEIEAARLSNDRAPEHLEIWVRQPGKILKNIRHAGAVFIGPWSPAVMGDYWTGPSHVLPTARSARFSSGLSVSTFMKRTNIIQISRQAFQGAAAPAQVLARTEGLSYHERSIRVRELRRG